MTRSVPQAVGPAPAGAAFYVGPRTHSEPAVMVACAGVASRQAPAFRLLGHNSETRLLSERESFALAISLVARTDDGMSGFVDCAGAPALLVRPRRDGVGGAPV